jgi:hypothetical protein
MTEEQEPDYNAFFEEHWTQHLSNEDGSLNEDAVRRELYDFAVTAQKFMQYINFTTGGRASDARITLEHLQDLAIQTATETCRRAVVEELDYLISEGQSDTMNLDTLLIMNGHRAAMNSYLAPTDAEPADD